MLTVAVLRSWEPEQLPRAGSDLQDTGALLGRLAGDVGVAVGEMAWRSTAADAARAAADDLCLALRTLSESFTMQAAAVRRAGAALTAAQDLLRRAVRLADDHGLYLLEDGSVSPPPPVLTAADLSPELAVRLADRRDAAEQARDRAAAMAREALACAAEADRDAAAALGAADRIGALLARVAPGAGGVLASTFSLTAYAAAERAGLLDRVDGRAVPARGSDPRQVNAWWESLPPGVRQALLDSSPELLGNLDGLPATVRHLANVARLRAERGALEAQIARIEGQRDPGVPVWMVWFVGPDPIDGGLQSARAKLAALDAVEKTLRKPDRSLLLLDTSGEQLRAAVSVGDVDAADHVGVFTPGLSTTVQGSLVGYDRQMGALRDQAGRLAVRAGTGTVATVSWLGYEAPQWGDVARPSRSVTDDGAAGRGAADLAAFDNGLDAARTRSAHLTALGHSYGSLTTSLALQRGTGVDDAVLFGSPGLGTSDVADLGLRPGRVYVAEARKDPVADLASFGSDPNQLDGVTALSAERSVIDGVVRQASVGHSAYLTDDTTSQYGMAAVVAGLPELVPHDDGFGLGDTLWWTP